MIRCSTLTAVLLVAAMLPVSASAPQRVQSVQDTLMQLERDWDAAFHRHDVAFIDSILADEFIATYDNGARVDKARELALAGDRSQQVDASSLDEFIIKTYGDTAVVWFTLHLAGSTRGRPFEITLRYTDVWVIRDGRWLCVSSQSTRLEPPQP